MLFAWFVSEDKFMLYECEKKLEPRLTPFFARALPLQCLNAFGNRCSNDYLV